MPSDIWSEYRGWSFCVRFGCLSSKTSLRQSWCSSCSPCLEGLVRLLNLLKSNSPIQTSNAQPAHPCFKRGIHITIPLYNGIHLCVEHVPRSCIAWLTHVHCQAARAFLGDRYMNNPPSCKLPSMHPREIVHIFCFCYLELGKKIPQRHLPFCGSHVCVVSLVALVNLW
jgi:hypothetical protein